MNHSLPQLLPECEAPAMQFCTTCRMKRGGRAFRETILGVRGVEDVAVDFDCPHGLPWIKESSRGLGDSVAALTSKLGIKPCGGCKRRQKWLNEKVSYKKHRSV